MSVTRISSDHIEKLEQRIELLLRASEQGMTEYDLLRALRDEGLVPFSELVFHDSFVLFQSHFVLFHSLHRLRRRLSEEGSGTLEISPLCLSIEAYTQTGSGLTEHNPMAEFYLDLENLYQTSADEVARMLGKFWSGMGDFSRRSEAYAVLGLEEGSKPAAIRKRYRELASEHHPDRGGDAERLKEINQAVDVLLGRNRSAN